ncbi:hypothetical protein HDU97_002209 [Phlyctochytrium planicorne]|nr:hypothetical protein HDU97_002209 [Phlyctochytrium planicorne]
MSAAKAKKDDNIVSLDSLLSTPPADSSSSTSSSSTKKKQSAVMATISHYAASLKKGFQDAIADNGSLAPILTLLTGSQLQACLLAFLPSYLAINTGNVAVDMFLITFAVTVCMALLTAGGNLIKGIINDTGAQTQENAVISVKIECHRIGKWGSVTNNIHWTALAWLISLRSKAQKTGAFRMATFESENNNQSDDEGETYDMPAFNILPRGTDLLEIEHEGCKFKVYFDQNDEQNNEGDKKKSEDDILINREPPIVIQRVDDEPVDLEWMQNFLIKVTTMFLQSEKAKRSRARFELNPSYGYWSHIQNLRASRGIDSVALDQVQEELLKRDLETFHNDAEFYKRMGLPYRRGYLFSGKPGTGKTSLVNAISSAYGRSLYYINLKEIRDDNALQSAFASVPKKSIIVFEDIDAQSAEVHSRDRRFALRRVEHMRMQKMREEEKNKEKKRKEKERKKKEKIKALKKLKKKQKQEEKKKRKEEEGEDAVDEEEEEEESEIDEEDVEVSDDEEEEAPESKFTSFSSGFDSDMEPMSFASASFGPSPSPFSSSGGSGAKASGGSDSKFGGLNLGGGGSLFSGFTLSALLNCLDGHMMNENVIVIMTTNHPEVLDSALIRPGRIDLHLELGYCTRYQLNRMYSTVIDKPEATLKFPSPFPENVIAPCDALRIMVLYRSNPDMIPIRLLERAYEILDGKPATSGLRAGQGSITMAPAEAPSPSPSSVSLASTLTPSSPTPARVVGGLFEPLKDKENVETNGSSSGSGSEEDVGLGIMDEGLRKRNVPPSVEVTAM